MSQQKHPASDRQENPAPPSQTQQKKQQKLLAKQQKRQERQRKKRQRHNQQRQQIQEALYPIGATWDGKTRYEGGKRFFSIRWRGEEHRLENPGAILRWAKRCASSREVDYAEIEIERLIAFAREEMQNDDNL